MTLRHTPISARDKHKWDLDAGRRRPESATSSGDKQRRPNTPEHQEPPAMTLEEIQRQLNEAIKLLVQAQTEVMQAVRKVYAVPRPPSLDERTSRAIRELKLTVDDVRSFAGRKLREAKSREVSQ